MQTTTPDKKTSVKSQSMKNLKRLRAAEARRRFELLQEQRLLRDHLADFWDTSLDKKDRHGAGSCPL